MPTIKTLSSLASTREPLYNRGKKLSRFDVVGHSMCYAKSKPRARTAFNTSLANRCVSSNTNQDESLHGENKPKNCRENNILLYTDVKVNIKAIRINLYARRVSTRGGTGLQNGTCDTFWGTGS